MKLLLFATGAFALSLGAIAQTPPKPSAPAAQPADAQLYRNSTFNFRYQIPYGWVDRTREMQEGNDKGEVLLAVFERPPQAAGDSINSAVVIASEKVSAYPGLKKAEDYLAPLTELTTAKGFQTEGDPSEADVSGQHLARADFSRKLNDQLTMHQSTLVLVARGQILTFTFLADSAEAVNDLIESLRFSASKSKTK